MEEKEKNTERLIKVTLINANETNALVEYDNKRVYIPVKHLQGGFVKDFILERGVQFGVDFKSINIEVSPEEVEKQMHKRNIWTREDIMSKPALVIAALQDALGLTLSNILQFVERKK